MVMDFYMIFSLATVFGLLAWWLYLAISGLRDESSTQQAECVTRQKPLGLANSLIGQVCRVLWKIVLNYFEKVAP